MNNSIWRRKPVDAYEAEMQKSELKRVLTKWGLTSLGIGAIIGGGIFTLTGIAAQNFAGPALAVSFIIAAIGCTFASLCYAEFSSILPVEGSAYAYSYGTMGEIFAWLIGWNLILEYMMGATTVAVAWSGYFEKLMHQLKIELPVTLMNDPYTAGEKLGAGGPVASFNVAAFLITWLVTSVLVRGIQESAKANNLIVILKLAVVLFVIFVGACYIDTANWTPFVPNEVVLPNGDTKFGWNGVITAATIVFFAYIGFDAVSTQAGEAINPRKDVPFAIIASLVICTVLYILVSLVLTGMVKYDTLDLKAPVASAFALKGITWAVYIITIAAVAGLTSVMLVMMLGQTRVFLGMAKDGLLPKFFSDIHPTFKTPWKSTLLVGFIVSVVSAVTPIDKVSEMCSMGTLLAFAMISAAVVILRVQKPDIERPYRAPIIWFVGPMGVLFNMFLMYKLRKETWETFLVWSALGFAVYFAFSFTNSKLSAKNSKTPFLGLIISIIAMAAFIYAFYIK
jgi:basic amino acid/polyamine antiporter, APA family